jgi:hypothetical protein
MTAARTPINSFVPGQLAARNRRRFSGGARTPARGARGVPEAPCSTRPRRPAPARPTRPRWRANSARADMGPSRLLVVRHALNGVTTLVSGVRRSMSGHGAMRLARGRPFKNAPQAVRSAEALFRQCRLSQLMAQPIGHRPADHPSRSGHREQGAGGAFFRAYAEAPCTDMLRRSGAPLT